MEAAQVFVKTEQGTVALQSGRATLPAAARNLLILLDGRRSLADLQSILGREVVESLLPSLQAQGYLRPVAAITPPGSELPPPPTDKRRAPRPAAVANTNTAAIAALAFGTLLLAGAIWWYLGRAQLTTVSASPARAAAALKRSPDTDSPAATASPGAEAPAPVRAPQPGAGGVAQLAAPYQDPPHRAVPTKPAGAAPQPSTPRPELIPAPASAAAASTSAAAVSVGAAPLSAANGAGKSNLAVAAASPASPDPKLLPGTVTTPPTPVAAPPAPGGSPSGAEAPPAAAGLVPSQKSIAATASATTAQKPLTVGLRPRERTVPTLSRRARRAGIDSGKLVVKLHLNPRGSVERVELISALPAQIYDAEVEQVLERWTYYPPGQPAEAIVELNFKP